MFSFYETNEKELTSHIDSYDTVHFAIHHRERAGKSENTVFLQSEEIPAQCDIQKS